MSNIYSGDLTVTNDLNVGSNINSTGLINGNNAIFNTITTDELTINTNITTNIQNFTTETINCSNASFVNPPVCINEPVNSYDLVNKIYVDTLVGSGGGGLRFHLNY